MAVTIPLAPTRHTRTATAGKHALALLSEGVAESGYKLLPKSPRPDTNHTSDSLHVMSPTHLFHLSLPDTYRVFAIPYTGRFAERQDIKLHDSSDIYPAA